MGLRRFAAGEIDTTLAALVEKVAGRLRKAERLCRTVVLRLRFGDYTRCTRSHTLPRPTDRTELLLTALRRTLAAMGPDIQQRGLTLLGVTLANLDAGDAYQLELPFRPAGALQVEAALDAVRAKYGRTAVGRATLLGRAVEDSVPLLPD